MNLSRFAIIGFISSSMLWSVAQAQTLPAVVTKNMVVDVQTELQQQIMQQTAQTVKAQLEEMRLELLRIEPMTIELPVTVGKVAQPSIDVNQVIAVSKNDETPLQMAQIQP
jgi:hypothetical protein